MSPMLAQSVDLLNVAAQLEHQRRRSLSGVGVKGWMNPFLLLLKFVDNCIVAAVFNVKVVSISFDFFLLSPKTVWSQTFLFVCRPLSTSSTNQPTNQSGHSSRDSVSRCLRPITTGQSHHAEAPSVANSRPQGGEEKREIDGVSS